MPNDNPGPGGGGSGPRLSKEQRERLRRLERRVEAGKKVNEYRLKKLQMLKEGKSWTGGSTKGVDPKVEKIMERIMEGDLLDKLFGGPGQDTSVSNVAALLASSPDLLREIAQSIADKADNVTRSEAFWGNEAVAAAVALARGLPRWGQAGSPVGNLESGGLPRDVKELAGALPALAPYLDRDPDLYAQLFIGEGGGPPGARQDGAAQEPDQTGLAFGQPPREMGGAYERMADVLDAMTDNELGGLGDALSDLMNRRAQKAAAQEYYGPIFDQDWGVE